MTRHAAVVRRPLKPAPSAREQYAAKQRELRKRLGISESSPAIRQVPSSPESIFTAEFIQALQDLNFESSWCGYVPSLLGAHKATDAAAKAVVKALDAYRRKDPAEVIRGTRSYMKAINELRVSIDTSDSALVAVNLLSVYEVIMRGEPQAYFSHVGGITAILLARPRSRPVTPLIRAILYANTHSTFQQPCLRGTASPFDDPYWLDMEPASFLEPLTDETAKLRKLSNQLMIRLPRLVAQVRTVRESQTPSDSDLISAIQLGSELLLLKDDQAESTVLHHVSVVPTKSDFDKTVVPYSFKFISSYEKETVLMYWGAKLMLVKLCVKLDSFKQKSLSNEDGENVSFNRDELDSEEERTVMSILMCWQDGFGLASPLNVVWAALMDRETFRGKPVEIFRHWVHQRFNDSFEEWPTIKLSREAMDETSDMFIGGPLEAFPSGVAEEISKKARNSPSSSDADSPCLIDWRIAYCNTQCPGA